MKLKGGMHQNEQKVEEAYFKYYIITIVLWLMIIEMEIFNYVHPSSVIRQPALARMRDIALFREFVCSIV